MNYLDLLPNDIMKIINREIHNAHIIKRRIERKQNRNMNREQKRIAAVKNIYMNILPDYTINIHMFKNTKNTQKELMTTIYLLKEYII
jgi:hypothetical protein